MRPPFFVLLALSGCGSADSFLDRPERGAYGRVKTWDDTGEGRYEGLAGHRVCAADPESTVPVDPAGLVCDRTGEDGGYLLPLAAGSYRLCRFDPGAEGSGDCDPCVLTVFGDVVFRRDRTFEPGGGEWLTPDDPGCPVVEGDPS